MTTWRQRLSDTLDGDGVRDGILAGVGVALLAPLVAMVLVFAADLVPDQRIVAQLDSAIDDGTMSGSDYGPAISGKQLDFFTDCVGITIGLGDLPEHSRWTSSIRNPTLASCSNAVPTLIEARDGELRRSWEYFRARRSPSRPPACCWTHPRPCDGQPPTAASASPCTSADRTC